MARELYRPWRYRLLAKVPLTVSFPSVSYRLNFFPVTGCPQWAFRADPLAGSPNWVLCHSGDHEKPVLLAVAVYERGFDVMHPTAPSTIMERLCREGRAVLISSALPQIAP